MATPILLPRQGQSVESCILTKFYVSVGEKVTEGTLLFAYETDKASFEEEAKEDGTILALFFEEGDEVPVLTNVGVIGEEGEAIDAFAPGGGADDTANRGADAQEETVDTGNEKLLEKDTAQVPDEKVASSTVANSIDGKVIISPRARRLAQKEDVDIQLLQGSGPMGRIIEADILQHLETRPRITPLAKKIMKEEGLVPDPLAGARQRVTSQDLVPTNAVYSSDSEVVPLTNIRKLIAGAMHRSLQNSAQLTHHLSADARRILELRGKVKAAQKEGYAHNLTLNDMICAAVVKTLKEFPNANAHFLGDSLRVFNKVHLGLAVDTERGLMVPAVKNADDLSIHGLSSQMKAVAESCRAGNVDPDLLSPEAASFTVSNLGNYGVEMFTPVINLPQVAILGVNTILPRPKDLGNGVYGFVPHLGLSLTYDHQALDGGEATRFLKAIATEIENLEIEL